MKRASGKAKSESIEEVSLLKQRIKELEQSESERIRAEEALKESRERFQGLVETMYDWVWEVDSRAHYTYVSPQIRRLLGYEPEEVLGKTPYDLMPPEEAKRVSAEFRELAKGQKPISALENINLHKDGHAVVLETDGLPFFDADGNVKGYRGTDRDITERKLAQVERERLIDQLQKALHKVKTLHGLLPICSSCKKVRDDKGYWEQIEIYIRDHSDAEFTHGICPECAERLYPGYHAKKEGPG